MTVNFVQLSEQSNNESPTSSILRAMEEIENVEAEVILLYTSTENIELMLQKVHLIASFCACQYIFNTFHFLVIFLCSSFLYICLLIEKVRKEHN